MRTVCLDSQILYHPLLRRLPPSQRWVFLTLLLLCGEGGRVACGDIALGEQDLADQAGISPEETERALERFLELGLIERRNGILLLSPDVSFQPLPHLPSSKEGKARPASTERVRRYRQKARSDKEETQNETVDETHNVTPDETQSETHETRYMKRGETQNVTLNETPDETQNETPEGVAFRFEEDESGDKFQRELEHGSILNEEENELKEKEERSKEERERAFLSPKRNAFSPEREKEKECREGGKEETPLLSQALPSSALPHSGEGKPSSERASLEGEGSLKGEEAAPGESGDTAQERREADALPVLDPPVREAQESRLARPEGRRNGLVPLKELLDKKLGLIPPPKELEAQGEDPARHLKGDGAEPSRASPQVKGQSATQKNSSPGEGLLEATFFQGKKAGSAPSHSLPALKEKGKQEPFSYPQEFEDFWSVYPRRIEKRKAFRAWQARLREGVSPETLIDCARNYAEYVLLKGTAECYIKHPATFLGPDRPFEDWKEKRKEEITIPKFSRAARMAIELAEKYEREEEDGGEDLNLLSL